MASGTVVFQTAVTATPPNALSIMADSVNDTDHGAGTAQYVKLMDGATGGTLKASVTANGLVVDTRGSILGTVQVHGTAQVLGTVRTLDGSVHLAAGSVNAQGVIAHGAAIAGNPLLVAAFGSSGTPAATDDGDLTRLWVDLNGRLQTFGTIGSITPITIGAALPAGNNNIGDVDIVTMPNVTIGAGTISLNTGGTAHIGSVQRLAGGTLDAFGGTIGGGTIQLHGTNQALGTLQPLAGSVHLATNLAGGSVVAVGSVAHGALAGAAMRPLLMAGVGSSGTQAAIGDGSVAQLWTDLNGRLQVRGTIDSIPSITIGAALPAGNNNIGDVDVASMPTVTVQATNLDIRDLSSASDSVSVLGTVQTHGTSQVIGTVQALSTMLFGSVQGWQAHDGAVAGNPLLMGAFGSSGTQAAVADGDTARLWTDLNGRLQIRGTIDSIPALVITSGTVSLQTGGTIHVGTVQRIQGGTIDSFGGTLGGGTVQLVGTVPTRTAAYPFGSYFGTAFTAAQTNGTLIAPLGQGTRWRLFDLTISASAAGTIVLQEAASGSVVFGPLFFAANGGMVLASAQGLRARGTNLGLFCTNSAGTMSVTVNYFLEVP